MRKCENAPKVGASFYLVAVLILLLRWVNVLRRVNLLRRIRLGRTLLLDGLLLVLLWVLGTHLVHLGLEDAHRTAEGTSCVRQAGCAEHEKDNQQQDEDVATREHEGFAFQNLR